MSKRVYLVLWLAGLVLGLGMLWLRPYTGYMDADYYYSGARTLYEGRGFQDYTIWNYLNQPERLPAPAFTYWMPMASLVGWLGMAVFRTSSLWAARIPFVFLFSLIPPLSASLSYSIHKNRQWSLISGLLVLGCGYFLKFVSEPDGFCILFLGGMAIIQLMRSWKDDQSYIQAGCLGVAAGVIHLTRADGAIWLILLAGWIIWVNRQKVQAWKHVLFQLACLLAGYAIMMGGWYGRNLVVFGRLMSASGMKAVFLTNYDQIFSYPPDLVNFREWWATGWKGIASPRINALFTNFMTLLAVFGMVVLVPSILAGIRKFWNSQISRFLLASAVVFFLIMSFAVPFVGMRGGLLHSGAVFMPIVWLLVPAGNAELVAWIRKNTHYTEFSEGFVHYSLTAITIIASIFILMIDRQQPENISQAHLWENNRQVDGWLASHGFSGDIPVIVNNPPGYYAATGRSAVVIPYGTPDTIQQVAERYGARIVVLDSSHIKAYDDLYNHPDSPPAGYQWLSSVGEFVIYQVDGKP